MEHLEQLKGLRLVDNCFTFSSNDIDPDKSLGLDILCQSVECPSIESIKTTILLQETVDRRALAIAKKMNEVGKFHAFVNEGNENTFTSRIEVLCEYISSKYVRRSWSGMSGVLLEITLNIGVKELHWPEKNKRNV